MNGYIVEFKANDTFYKGRVKDRIKMVHEDFGVSVTGYLIEASSYINVEGLWKAVGEAQIIPCYATDIKKIIT